MIFDPLLRFISYPFKCYLKANGDPCGTYKRKKIFEKCSEKFSDELEVT